MDKAAMLCSLEPAAVTQAGKVHDMGNDCSATVSGPTCHDEFLSTTPARLAEPGL